MKIERRHSVRVRASHPQLLSWESRGDQSFALIALAKGYTSFRVDVSRGDSAVFTTSLIVAQIN